jgi:hypothetical protein
MADSGLGHRAVIVVETGERGSRSACGTTGLMAIQFSMVRTRSTLRDQPLLPGSCLAPIY